MTKRSLSQENNHGFSLLETLVALMLVALLLNLALGGLRSVETSWQHLQVAGENQAELAEFRQFAERVLSSPSLLPTTSMPDRGLLFLGDRHRLVFSGKLPRGVGGADVGVYRWAFKPDGALQLAWAQDRGGQFSGDFPPIGGDVSYFAGASDVSFSYFGQKRPGTSPDWSDDWDVPAHLPQLVRITVEKGRQERQILVAVRVEKSSCLGASKSSTPTPDCDHAVGP